MIITIDGPGGAGKGTLAAGLAKKYNLAYFDTGMVYRATGLQMFLKGLNPNDESKAEEIAKELTFQKMTELSKHPEFRSSQNGQYASMVAAHPKVRAALLKMQQDFSHNPVFPDGTKANGAIYDGRDTGTEICPHADFKFFLTASIDVRAEHRFKELQEKGLNTAYETVFNDIKVRDERDYSRTDAPLKPAPDAIIIDSTNMTIPEVLETAVKVIG